MVDYKKEFTKFLDEYNCYSRFVENVGRNHGSSLMYYLKGKHPENYIMDAFHWYNTPQGRDYWWYRNKGWTERIEDLRSSKSMYEPVKENQKHIAKCKEPSLSEKTQYLRDKGYTIEEGLSFNGSIYLISSPIGRFTYHSLTFYSRNAFKQYINKEYERLTKGEIMTKKELLEEFLESKNIPYLNFKEIRNTHRYMDEGLPLDELIEKQGAEIINYAIDWNETDLGYDFWSPINKEYKQFYKENKHRLKSNFTLEIKGLEHTIKFENGRVKIGCEDFSEEKIPNMTVGEVKELAKKHNVTESEVNMYTGIAYQILKNKENL